MVHSQFPVEKNLDVPQRTETDRLCSFTPVKRIYKTGYGKISDGGPCLGKMPSPRVFQRPTFKSDKPFLDGMLIWTCV